MTQDERLEYLINALLEDPACAYAVDGRIAMPPSCEDRRHLLRALMNVRMPEPASDELLAIQDAYLKERLADRGVSHVAALPFNTDDITVWRGDITTLDADAIVNAANSQMLGCFVPNHRCIDNAIHTYAGIQLRLACKRIMDEQGALSLPPRTTCEALPSAASPPASSATQTARQRRWQSKPCAASGASIPTSPR